MPPLCNDGDTASPPVRFRSPPAESAGTATASGRPPETRDAHPWESQAHNSESGTTRHPRQYTVARTARRGFMKMESVGAGTVQCCL